MSIGESSGAAARRAIQRGAGELVSPIAAARVDEFGSFGFDCSGGVGLFVPEGEIRERNWLCTGNSGEESESVKIVWFNDQDRRFTRSLRDDGVGFTPGEIPRVYFFEESDLEGPGSAGIADRNHRISVAAKTGDGITFDGYFGVNSPHLLASDIFIYLRRNTGIHETDLNTFQEIAEFGELTGIDLDADEDMLIDEPGDVAAAMQFSLDLDAGESATLAFNYVGGSLSNAVFPLASRSLHAGDADQDLDFDQLDLVKVQVAAKYLTGEAATWGEGDWDGAPGGEQGDPPAGDGKFDQLDIVSALSGGVYLAGPYAALKHVSDGYSISDLTDNSIDIALQSIQERPLHWMTNGTVDQLVNTVGDSPYVDASQSNVDMIPIPEPNSALLFLTVLICSNLVVSKRQLDLLSSA